MKFSQDMDQELPSFKVRLNSSVSKLMKQINHINERKKGLISIVNLFIVKNQYKNVIHMWY